MPTPKKEWSARPPIIDAALPDGAHSPHTGWSLTCSSVRPKRVMTESITADLPSSTGATRSSLRHSSTAICTNAFCSSDRKMPLAYFLDWDSSCGVSRLRTARPRTSTRRRICSWLGGERSPTRWLSGSLSRRAPRSSISITASRRWGRAHLASALRQRRRAHPHTCQKSSWVCSLFGDRALDMVMEIASTASAVFDVIG